MQRLARVGLEQYNREAIELFHHYDDIAICHLARQAYWRALK